jgi:hypothetical protein
MVTDLCLIQTFLRTLLHLWGTRPRVDGGDAHGNSSMLALQSDQFPHQIAWLKVIFQGEDFFSSLGKTGHTVLLELRLPLLFTPGVKDQWPFGLLGLSSVWRSGLNTLIGTSPTEYLGDARAGFP